MKFLEFLINKESQTRDEKYLMKFDGFDVKKSTTEAIKEHQRRKNFTLITQIIILMQISQIKQMVLIPQKNKKTIWTTRTIKKRCP